MSVPAQASLRPTFQPKTQNRLRPNNIQSIQNELKTIFVFELSDAPYHRLLQDAENQDGYKLVSSRYQNGPIIPEPPLNPSLTPAYGLQKSVATYADARIDQVLGVWPSTQLFFESRARPIGCPIG
jgi:hypothetical protein